MNPILFQLTLDMDQALFKCVFLYTDHRIDVVLRYTDVITFY